MIQKSNNILIIFSILIFSVAFFILNDKSSIFRILLPILFYIASILLIITSNIRIQENAGLPKTRITELLDLLEDGIVIINVKNLNFLYVNQSLLKKSQYKKNELIGKSIITLYPNFTPENIQQRIQPLIAKEADFLVLETVITRKDGTNCQAIVKLKYFSDTNTLISIGHDITEERKIQNIKAQCVSDISHEIRTSLTKISGALKIILNGMVGEVPVAMKEMLKLADDNTSKLLDDMNELVNKS